MEGQNLGASEIVTALQVRGKLDIKKTIVVDDLVCAPALGGGIITVLEDLEPTIASSCRSLEDVSGVGRIGCLPVSSMAEETFFK